MQTIPTLAQREQAAQFFWLSFIVLFFLLQAILWTVAILVTSHDPSHVVLADFENQSLHWDQQQSIRLASDQLAWEVKIEVVPQGDASTMTQVLLSVEDRSHQPVTDATVEMAAFHCSRAAEVQALEFQPIDAGKYRAVLKHPRTGRWNFSGAVRRGTDCRLIQERVFVEF